MRESERKEEKKNKTGTGVPASQRRKESLKTDHVKIPIFNENILKIIVTIATGQER